MARIIENARVLYLGPSDLNRPYVRGEIDHRHVKSLIAFEDAEIVIYRHGHDSELLKSRW